jgi:hypothetical protein
MRDLASFGLSELSFSLLRGLLPLLLPLRLLLQSLFVFLRPASLGLDATTRLANPRVAGRPMLRADPFLPALDVYFGWTLPSGRTVTIPWIFNIALVLGASRGPVPSSSANSLRIIPRQIFVFFFFFFFFEVM